MNKNAILHQLTPKFKKLLKYLGQLELICVTNSFNLIYTCSGRTTLSKYVNTIPALQSNINKVIFILKCNL